LTIGIIIPVSACAREPTDAKPENLPADHTVGNDGFLHRPGFETPFAPSSGCTVCHGAGLRDGSANINGVNVTTPSCFSGHGQRWSS